MSQSEYKSNDLRSRFKITDPDVEAPLREWLYTATGGASFSVKEPHPNEEKKVWIFDVNPAIAEKTAAKIRELERASLAPKAFRRFLLEAQQNPDDAFFEQLRRTTNHETVEQMFKRFRELAGLE